MKKLLLASAALSLFTLPIQAADFTETVAKAVEDGAVNLSFRYRYEFVDSELALKDANANTLKSRLTFAPQFTPAWSALIEVDDVRHIGSAYFNDTRNGKTEYAAVLDPKGTDLNQALLKYTGIKDTALIAGRQRINRGDQRFVGGVAWRQNEQTYDSVSAAYGDNGPLQVYYSYVYQVNRVFGPEDGTPTRKFDSNTHLADVSYKFNKLLKLTGYAYLMDFDNVAAFSNETYGIRAAGVADFSDSLSFNYAAEAATQSDYGDNTTSYRADYYRLEAGLGWSRVGLKAGYEVLGGGGDLDAGNLAKVGSGFRTPLATLHKFQGWADRFVGASAGGLNSGIKDAWAGVTGKFLAAKWQLIYHDFSADKGGRDYGSEIDLAASWSFTDHYGVLLKYARFDNKEYIGDLTRGWVQLTAKF